MRGAVVHALVNTGITTLALYAVQVIQWSSVDWKSPGPK